MTGTDHRWSGPDSGPSVTARWLADPVPIYVSGSPDGVRLAVTTTRVPLGTEDEQFEITLVDTATGTTVPLAAAGPGDHSATWSPDGARLAIVTARNGTAQLVICAPGETDTPIMTELPGGVTSPPSWSADGRLVVAARRGRAVDRTRPWRITRPVQWGDGIGALDDPPQLWICDPATGACEQLTDDEWRWSLPRWSPDGRMIAARASHDPSGQRRGQHLRLVDLDGSWAAPAVPGGFAVVPAWAGDGSLLVLSLQPEGQPGGSEAELNRILPNGTIVRLDRGAPVPVGGTVYGDSPAAVGDAFETALLAREMEVFVRTQRGGRMGIAHLDLDAGTWSVMSDGDHCATPLAVAVAVAGQGLVIADQAADRPCRLAIIGMAEGKRTELPLAARHDSEPTPPTAEVTRWTVPSPHDGAALDAWHLRPAGADGPLPTVLIIHGGPNAAYGECFHLDAQALCAAGFGVVYTNPHGSTGYGDPFTHSVSDHWGDIPSGDVLAVVGDAIRRGWADPDRLGVCGNSYGGYLTTWLACTTDRFRAAVAENPVTDLLSMYGTSDIGPTFLPMQLGSTPLDDVQPYLRWSPLLRAADCTTPILFVVGDEDRRCPSSQAFEMHRTLHALGRTSEMLVLPGSSHEGSTFGPPEVRLAQDAALVEWMVRWLGATP